MMKSYVHIQVGFIVTFVCLSLVPPVSAQSTSLLNAQELWQFGRGVINDFSWAQSALQLATNNGVWQVEPTSSQEPSRLTLKTEVFRLSTSPDGTHFISYDSGNFLLWDAQTKTVITTIRPGGYVENDAIAWQPNGDLLATVGYDDNALPGLRYKVEIWDADTGEQTTTVGGYSEIIVALSWHPAGSMLGMRLSNGTIYIEDVVSGERVRELTADAANSATIAWSPDGSKLAASTNGESPVKSWRSDTFEPILARNQPPFVLTVVWNADSVRLAGALPGGGVGIWNVETGELMSLGVEADNSGIDQLIERIEWNGHLLATLDRSQRLRVWNADNNEFVWDSAEHGFHSPVQDIAVSPDGTLLAVGYHSAEDIPVLDAKTGTLHQVLRSPHLLYGINQIGWSLSGEQLAVSTDKLSIWSLNSNPSARPLEVKDVTHFSWSSDDRLAVTSTYEQNELRFINGLTGEQLDSREVPGIRLPLWSPNGSSIALYRYNLPGDEMTIPSFQIDLWEPQQNLTTTVNFPQDMIPAEAFAWLPDSSGLIGFATSGALWRWTVGAGEAEIVTSPPNVDMQNQPFSLSINADGNLLAVSHLATDWQVQVLDATSGNLLVTIKDLTPGARFLEWGANDTLVVYDGILHAYQVGSSG